MWGVLLVLSYFAMALIAAAVILQPDRFVVRRSAVIRAEPSVVFEKINRLREWDGWSPWAKLDPKARMEHSAVERGQGASFSWDGGGKVGAGRLTIVDSVENESVTLKLEMTRPFAAQNDVYFNLSPAGLEGTHVEWAMAGRASFLAKAVNLIAPRDKMLGGMFEQGLANLQAACVG